MSNLLLKWYTIRIILFSLKKSTEIYFNYFVLNNFNRSFLLYFLFYFYHRLNICILLKKVYLFINSKIKFWIITTITLFTNLFTMHTVLTCLNHDGFEWGKKVLPSKLGSTLSKRSLEPVSFAEAFSEIVSFRAKDQSQKGRRTQVQRWPRPTTNYHDLLYFFYRGDLYRSRIMQVNSNLNLIRSSNQ